MSIGDTVARHERIATLVAVGAVLTPDPSSSVLLAPVVAVPLVWRTGMADSRRA